MNNNDYLALQIALSYIQTSALKGEIQPGVESYCNNFFNVYSDVLKRVEENERKRQASVMQEFGTDENSLTGRIK